MHENARGRVTFLLNLMFSRLDKSDDAIFGRECVAYIRNVHWVTYLGGVYSRRRAYIRRRFKEILRYFQNQKIKYGSY